MSLRRWLLLAACMGLMSGCGFNGWCNTCCDDSLFGWLCGRRCCDPCCYPCCSPCTTAAGCYGCERVVTNGPVAAAPAVTGSFTPPAATPAPGLAKPMPYVPNGK